MDNSSLGRLKGIAAGGKAKLEKPMALRPADKEGDDTLELRVDNIVEDAEFEEMGNEEAVLKADQNPVRYQANITNEVSREKVETAEAKAPAENEAGAGRPDEYLFRRALCWSSNRFCPRRRESNNCSGRLSSRHSDHEL